MAMAREAGGLDLAQVLKLDLAWISDLSKRMIKKQVYTNVNGQGAGGLVLAQVLELDLV